MSAPITSMDSKDLVDQDLDMESDDSDWEEEIEQVSNDTKCLFCDNISKGAEATLQHCHEQHSFNLSHVKKIHNMDCFGFIKMINYIRKMNPSAEKFKQIINELPAPWNDDSYMKPELEDDPMLQFDIEEMEGSNTADKIADDKTNSETIPIEIEKYSNLLRQLKQAEERTKEAEDQLQHALSDLQQMRQAAQNLVLTNQKEPAPTHQAVQHLQDGEDEFYVDSYSHFSIHQEMLQDKVRTESYRDAICKNENFFKDKVVLDIGCGTGILSMFAARAGAKKVVGVEMSDIIYQAMDIVRENDLDEVITLVKGRLEDVEMPVEEFDVIVSEWMGYFLLFESMLDTVLYARDRWLKQGGVMLPDNCAIYLSGSSDPSFQERNLDYWKDVYGFKMSCMRQAVVQEASVAIVNDKYIITDACLLKDIDICKATTKDLEFSGPFKLTAKEDCVLTALVGYFDTNFKQLKNTVHFSTSPSAPATHWKQTVFLLHEPIALSKGSCMEGQLICRKNRKDPRSLKVSITINSKTYTYLVQ